MSGEYSGIPLPTISANDLDIAYNAISGAIEYSINNVPNPAGTLTAAVQGTPTIADFTLGSVTNTTVPFSCSANNTNSDRTATVRLTYTYGRSAVTKDVTITQALDPNAVDLISDITAAGNYTVRGTIVAISNRGFVLGDGTGYVYYYKGSDFTPSNYAIGDVKKLSGAVTASSNYKVFQFGSNTEITTAASSNYVTESPTVISGSEMDTRVGASTCTLSSYVQYEGRLSVTTNNSGTHYNITNIEGANTAVGSISYPLNTDFTSLNGKKVIVTGYYVGVSSSQYYNTMLGSIEEVIVPVINASDLNIAFDATSGTIGYTITNPVEGTTLNATCSASWISNITVGAESVTFTCSANNTTSARTATFTLTYAGADNKTVTVTQAASSADYAILTFFFDGGRADVANTLGLTQVNLGTDYTNSPKLKFEKGNKDNDGKYSTLILHFNERPGELSYDIKGNDFSGGTFKVQVSTDGVTYTDWATYTQLTTTLQHITFNNLDENVRYIKWIYTQKVSGNVALGNIKLKKYEAPQPYTLSINNLQDVRVYASAPGYGTITNGYSFTIPSVTVVTLIAQHSDDFVLDEILVLDEGNNPISLTPVPQTQNQWTFYMPNSNVTVSASVVAAHPPVNYVLASSIESGKRYIIVGQKNGQYYAMGSQKPNNRIAKLISVEGNTATVTRSDVLEFTITSLQQQGFYSIYDETEPGYLYAGDYTENRLLTEATLDEDGEWEITINAQTGVASVVASNSNNINVMQFNSNYELFNCYGSASQNPVYLYQIEDGFPLEITGYTGTKDHYYLISTPVTVDPSTVEGMVTGDYDLYYFDQSQNLEWINYKGDASLGHPGHFSLEPGTGYLYAKAATTGHSTYTFHLAGELYDGTGDIPVVEGWNLVGNPYAVEAEIGYWDGFLVMNEGTEGSELVVCWDSYILQPMQAAFCYVESLDDYPVITFSRQEKGVKHSGLSLNLSKGSSLVDRAVVRFDEGHQLPKFQLNENSTKVYIPQNDKEYAVVRSANDGEMPVSFKAEHNGTYTLSADLTELEMNYLHLIDNMTGADVDLLATPSYTFEAKTTDYVSRFKLVFSANDEAGASTGSEAFAYYNGSEWVVTGKGTLQVVDVNGRVLSSETVNGNATINLNETPGVYMLRLVNGEEVRTQKIVVR